MVSAFWVLVGLGVNGFFTGLGVITANTFFEYFVKPKIKRFHKRVSGVVKVGGG